MFRLWKQTIGVLTPAARRPASASGSSRRHFEEGPEFSFRADGSLEDLPDVHRRFMLGELSDAAILAIERHRLDPEHRADRSHWDALSLALTERAFRQIIVDDPDLARAILDESPSEEPA